LQNFVRFCLRVFFRVFKTRCSIQFDEKKLPKKGVYVSNHVSFLDPVLLFAFLPGNPVFALNGHLYRRKWIRFLMKPADTGRHINKIMETNHKKRFMSSPHGLGYEVLSVLFDLYFKSLTISFATR
jgi:hypothetical protein